MFILDTSNQSICSSVGRQTDLLLNNDARSVFFTTATRVLCERRRDGRDNDVGVRARRVWWRPRR